MRGIGRKAAVRSRFVRRCDQRASISSCRSASRHRRDQARASPGRHCCDLVEKPDERRPGQAAARFDSTRHGHRAACGLMARRLQRVLFRGLPRTGVRVIPWSTIVTLNKFLQYERSRKIVRDEFGAACLRVFRAPGIAAARDLRRRRSDPAAVVHAFSLPGEAVGDASRGSRSRLGRLCEGDRVRKIAKLHARSKSSRATREATVSRKLTGPRSRPLRRCAGKPASSAARSTRAYLINLGQRRPDDRDQIARPVARRPCRRGGGFDRLREYASWFVRHARSQRRLCADLQRARSSARRYRSRASCS